MFSDFPGGVIPILSSCHSFSQVSGSSSELRKDVFLFKSIVCHKGELYVSLYHACNVRVYFSFKFRSWVTLPRAAQLLIYVPPNGGNLTANIKTCVDNLVESLFCQTGKSKKKKC